MQACTYSYFLNSVPVTLHGKPGVHKRQRPARKKPNTLHSKKSKTLKAMHAYHSGHECRH
jgi:hypothetical protein